MKDRFRAWVRDATWLTADRVQAYANLLLAIPVLYFVVSIDWRQSALPVAQDFAAFWTAAELARFGRPAAAYGDAARQAMAVLFGPGNHPSFFYTPIGLLLWLPFALLPAAAAAAVWVAGTAAAYTLTLRAMVRTSLVVPLAYPAVLVCALYGQNGLFSAALFAGIALTLDRSPGVAGVLVGCLAYKPQLGVLIPLALLCARRFRAFAAAACTVIALAVISAAVFGPKTWTSFLESLPVARAWNASGAPGFDRFVSAYAAARLLGGSAAAGRIAQLVFIVPACVALAWTALRRPGGAAEVAMLAVATGICVPFLGEYDLCILAVPGAWIAAQSLESGWLPYERILLAALYVSPLAIKAAALHGVPLAPAAMSLLALLVVRRQLPGNSFH